MAIDELECKTCGCKGIHACLGRQIPVTKVGQAVYVNDIRDFVERQFTNGRWHKCLACGEHHDNGNLPCPFQRVTA